MVFVDLARAPLLADIIEHSESIGTQILPYPGEGYVYSLLFYIPRVLAPFKGYASTTYYTSQKTNTAPENLTWGLAIGCIEESVLNFGFLLSFPDVIILRRPHRHVRSACCRLAILHSAIMHGGRLDGRPAPAGRVVGFRHHDRHYLVLPAPLWGCCHPRGSRAVTQAKMSMESEQTQPSTGSSGKPGGAGLSASGATSRKQPSFRQNYSLMLLGNVIYTICQWAMLMVLAKLTQPDKVGQFALGLAVVGPVILFAGLQLRNIQATDARERYRFGDYLLLRLLCVVLALLVIALIVLKSHYDDQTRLVILVIGFAKAIEAMSDVFYGFFQQFEQMSYIAISMIIKGMSSIFVLWFCVSHTKSVLYGCIGLAITWLTVFLCYDVPCSRKLARALRGSDYRQLLALRYDFPLLAQITWLALPLGGVMMLISLSGNMPRYYLVHYQGEYAVGIFSALYSLLVAGSAVIGAFGQAATPRLAHLYADGHYRGFYLLLQKLLLIGALIGGAGIYACTGVRSFPVAAPV